MSKLLLIYFKPFEALYFVCLILFYITGNIIHSFFVWWHFSLGEYSYKHQKHCQVYDIDILIFITQSKHSTWQDVKLSSKWNYHNFVFFYIDLYFIFLVYSVFQVVWFEELKMQNHKNHHHVNLLVFPLGLNPIKTGKYHQFRPNWKSFSKFLVFASK